MILHTIARTIVLVCVSVIILSFRFIYGIYTHMNNDLYTRTITDPEGRVYHYDPDQDIYYRRYEPMSKWDRFGWLAVTLVLVLAALYFEYNPIR